MDRLCLARRRVPWVGGHEEHHDLDITFISICGRATEIQQISHNNTENQPLLTFE